MNVTHPHPPESQEPKAPRSSQKRDEGLLGLYLWYLVALFRPSLLLLAGSLSLFLTARPLLIILWVPSP